MWDTRIASTKSFKRLFKRKQQWFLIFKYLYLVQESLTAYRNEYLHSVSVRVKVSRTPLVKILDCNMK